MATQDDPRLSTVRDVLQAVRAEFAPGELYSAWECWRGVSGILYARWRGASPPIVVRAVTVGALAVLIRERQEAQQ